MKKLFIMQIPEITTERANQVNRFVFIWYFIFFTAGVTIGTMLRF